MSKLGDYTKAYNPQPGDLWHEFFSYWYWVESVEGRMVTYREGQGGQPISNLPAKTVDVGTFGYHVRFAAFARNTLTPAPAEAG